MADELTPEQLHAAKLLSRSLLSEMSKGIIIARAFDQVKEMTVPSGEGINRPARVARIVIDIADELGKQAVLRFG